MTHLVTLTGIQGGARGVLDDFGGRDDPERIKFAIVAANKVFGAKYVMLVGDPTVMPTRMVFDGNTDNITVGIVGDYRPSDLYYACLYHHGAQGVVASIDTQNTAIENERVGLFDSWDLNGDNRYNDSEWGMSALAYNPDFVAGYPDIAVGRVPARTVADVEAYVNKVVAFEASPLALVGPRAWSFLADGAYEGSQSDCDSIKSVIPTTLLGSSRSELITSPFVQPETEQLESGWSVTDNTSIASLMDSSWWLTYVGHGSNGGWDYTPGVSGAVAGLQNPTYPIVFAVACQTGEFRGFPPNGAYQDIAGMFRSYRQDGTNKLLWTELDPNGATIGSITGALNPATPSGYDLSDTPAGQTVACAWLFNPSGGGVAYFGETLVCEDDKGTELAKDLVAALGQLTGSHDQRSLGDAWLLAQQKYWSDNCEYSDGATDPFKHPRIYLGIMTFFGDPSLQLCVPRPPVLTPTRPVLGRAQV